MARFPGWSSTRLCIGCAIVLAGCGAGVELIQEGRDRGVVQYRYQSFQDPVLAPLRREALAKIDRYCQGDYRVVREGQTKTRQRLVEGIGGAEVVTENWWGIRFRCTPARGK